MAIIEHKELNPDYFAPEMLDIPQQKGFDDTVPDNLEEDLPE